MGRVLVIGGGAAGLMAAISAAEAGAQVSLWEAGPEPGKKLLATGNGKCNCTNLALGPEDFRTESPERLKPLLASFPPEAALEVFEKLGVSARLRNGYAYPRSEQAASLRDALVWRARELSVDICCGRRVTSLRQSSAGWQAEAFAEAEPLPPARSGSGPSGSRLASREAAGRIRETFPAVVLAAGGRAAPSTGSDGSGYRLAQAQGHSLVPVTPALVPLTAQGFPFRKTAGVRTSCRVEIWESGILLAEDTGELQLTDYGVSGIPVFQVSRFAARALAEGRKPEARLNFFPEWEPGDLSLEFKRRQQTHPHWRSGDFLNGLLPRKLAEALLSEAGISLQDTWAQIPDRKRQRLGELCQCLTVEITGTRGFGAAQACAGGVPLTEVGESLESRKAPGLFLAGELLDVDGRCGGYNLHWAWTSGRLAGQEAARLALNVRTV